MTEPVVTHVGICVADLERSERFYVRALGFSRRSELSAPDDITTRLLRVPRPVNLRAVYLGSGDFVLELLHFDRPDSAAPRERALTEPGLTHLSLVVDDIAATSERVTAHGGQVLADTDVTVAVLVRDPDGQIIELVAHRRQRDGTAREDEAGGDGGDPAPR